jgi:hypothetical protein
MTKYQIAQFKRAVKRDLSKRFSKPENKLSSVRYNFPREPEKSLPDYIANNPWY